ncbi:beta strand repeat-containing protein [Flavobacterium sp. W22_SRS_FP1]|uniref:beta strand repeat-containing protein n=1 Tax=Flavobacterium sp. W22_SRS_FP1 TaxID=3240276 RepID=UPI003F90905C
MGGSGSNGGSYTWNGLTVGDGPSIGASGFNGNAMDIYGNITTNGGDFLAWAGVGSGGIAGIGNDGSGDIVSVGSGDIVLITDMVSGSAGAAMYFNQTGGTFTLVPHDGSFRSTFNWNPSVTAYVGSTADDYNLQTGDFDWLGIGDLNSITSLTIGYYNGMLSNGIPVEFTNSSNVTFSTATTSAGAFNLYGGAIAMNTSLTTTSATNGNISINGTSISGTGNLALAAGRNATINVSSTSSYDGILNGSGSAFTKLGAGMLTLTKDHTYSGPTVITVGNLQIGSGGSVSQASSGAIASTSSVNVASGAKLILAPNENVLFAAPISGDGGVEIKGMSGRYLNTWLTGTPTLFATNTTVLEALTRITGGLMGGAAIGGGSAACGAYQKSYTASANTGTLQLQVYNGVSPTFYTKCVFVKLTQSGLNVMIQVNTTILGSGAGYRSGNVLGTDISVGGSAMGLATSAASAGYGISEVYMSGKVNFTGNLSYSGNTVLSNTVTSVSNATNISSYTSKGTQEITDASSSFPGAIVNNGLVILNRTTPLTIVGDMSGTEDVLQVGAAVTMTGTNTHTGTTTIDKDKTLNIGAGASAGSMTGNIVNYGALTFNRTGSSSYPGVISGSGSVTKSGSDDLTMNNLNTYTGATTINAGSLILEQDVPTTSSISYSGAGTLVIQPSSASFTNAVSYPISGFNVSSTIGGLTIGKLGNSANLTVTNATAAQGPITLYSGTLTLNAAVTASNNGAIYFYSDNAIGGLSSPRAVTAGGLFNYIPQSNSFNAAVTYPISNLNVSSAGLTIGKETNTSDISFENNTTIAGPITAYGGTIALNAALTATNSNINLTASTAATQTAAITANGLALNGAGTFTLENTANNIATIAAGSSAAKIGSISFVDAAGGLEIGTVNPTGITSTGPIKIETLEGNITLSENLATDDTTADAIILNAGKTAAIGTATGGDIIVSGTPTVTYGTGGRAKLFSGRDSNSTGLTTLVGGVGNKRVSVDETTVTFSPVLANNTSYALYRADDIQASIISNFNAVNKMYHDVTFTIGTPTSNSTGAFTYTSSNPAVATISGSIVTILSAGTSTITANQAADGNFSSGSVTALLTVGSEEVLLINGGTSHTNPNYIDSNGKKGGSTGVTRYGEIKSTKSN